MKFTWGHAAIAIPVTIVVVFTTVLIRSMADENKTELVTDNYYEKEIQFQDQIDHTKNAEALNSDLIWKKVNNYWVFGIKGDFIPTDITGKIMFFRPSDQRLDVSIPISLDSLGQQQIGADKIKMGKYQIQVEWKVDETICYLEKNIFIQ